MTSDVPGRPRDRRVHGPRAGAVVGAAIAAVVAGGVAGCGGYGGESSTAASSTATQTTTSSGSTSTTSTESTTSTGGTTTTGQVGQAHSLPEVVYAVLTSADPSNACGSNYVTAHYLSVAYGGKGGCVKAQAPKSAARSLHMDDVIPITATKPPRASVHVVPDGGLYDGEKITVTLVREDGTWKVDALKSNAPVGP